MREGERMEGTGDVKNETKTCFLIKVQQAVYLREFIQAGEEIRQVGFSTKSGHSAEANFWQL